MQNARNSRGFVLPTVLLGLTILGVLSGAGLLMSWMELQAARSHTVGTRAYHAAEAGLATAQTYSGRPPPLRAITLEDGSATIRSKPLLDVAVGGSLYLIESLGAIVDRGRTIERTVSRVLWVGDAPAFDAALSIDVASAPGSIRAGMAAGYITGHPPLACQSAAGAGVVAAGPVATGAVALAGAPPLAVPSPGATAARRTGLRWSDFTSGALPSPDATIPGDAWPPAGAGWPYVRLTAPGPLGPGHSGRGVIVADGDLELANGFAWRGLVLVGGSLRFFGDVDLRGAVFVGLDSSLPSSIDLGDGLVAVEFDPCAADQAARKLVPYPAGVPGTWREEW
ncbi:MAG: hypothetical protein ACC682_09410 [Gemmatimonadota bacterium]